MKFIFRFFEKIKNKISIKLSSGFKKYSVNTSWLFFGKILESIVALFVTIYLARYLGPNNYGLLNYAISFVLIFSAISTLGLDNIVIRELVKDEKKRDELLGTAFILKLIGSILFFGILALAIRFTGSDNFTSLLIFIIAGGIIFQSFNVIDFYFRSRVLSKYAVYAQISAKISSAIIKILLIYFGMGLIYFAAVVVVENIILAAGLITVYSQQKLSIFNWRPKFRLAKTLLRDSWPLILSGMAIMVDMRVDQVMLGKMVGLEEVGIYAVAVKLAEAWYFIPILVVGSLFPSIINAKKISKKIYYERIQKLYDLLVWSAIFIAIPISIFSTPIVRVLFGPEYSGAGLILAIYIWAGIFVSLGVARSSYIISENLTIYYSIAIIIGVTMNVLMNLFLIPMYGGLGATIATMVSYSVEGYFSSLFFKPLRRTFYMQTKAIFMPLTIYKILKKRHL